MQIQNKKHLFFLFSTALFLPILLMLIIYAFLGIYPFGERCVLALDMNNQYISYFSYLKEILRGNHSLFYTFSKTLGGDMIGLFAYYLMSPLNLLLLLFPLSQLPTAIEILTLLKLGLCGLSFFLCIFQKDNSWHGWIFSTAYALMSYNIVYQTNLMWLDEMILLPLMVLGIRRIFQKKSPFLYLTVLFFAIILNYYIGFMLCIFSVLYFLYYFCFEDDRERFLDFKIIFRYGSASALAGGLGMWLIFPVLKSLAGGKAVFSLSSLAALTPNFHWSDFLVKFFLGSFDLQEIKTGLPNVFCGMTALFFLALFFLNRRISLRKKAGAFGLFLVLFLSFYLKGPNLIWHGFNAPVWFPYRYSFLFSFLMLLFAEEGFRKGSLLSLKELSGLSAAVLLVLSFTAFRLNSRNFPFMTREKYLLSLGLSAGAALLYLTYVFGTSVSQNAADPAETDSSQKTKRRNLIPVLLLVLLSLELSINGVSSLKSLNYMKYAPYQEFAENTEPAVNYVKESDSSFYRMEKTFSRKECDPMLLDFKGLSHYSSTEKNIVKYFMGQSGFRNNGNWSYYNRGSSYAMDSLLGIKYVLSKKPLESPYQLLDTINDISIYQNPYALPLGFMTDPAVLSCGIDNPHKFELQNSFWTSVYGNVGKNIFQPEQVEETKLKNLTQSDSDHSYYYKKKEDKRASITYTFTAQSDDPIFAYFGTNEMHPVKIKVNGESMGKYFDVYQYDIIRLGSFKKGETVKVEMILKDTLVNVTDVWFYYQDMDIFSEYYTAVMEEPVKIDSFSDTDIRGTISNDTGRDYALFTIPQEEGWHAYIDGEETETTIGMGLFLAVKIPAGTHQIELRYVPAGLKTGLLLTGVSLLCTGVWIFLYRRKSSSYKN